MSLTRQLWVAILASTAIALVASLLASLLAARSYLGEQLTLKNTDNANALALSLSQGEVDDVTVELAVKALADSGQYELIRVVNPKGEPVVERAGPARDAGAPGWFVRLLPITAEPGTARISKGWIQYGSITVVSESRFAYAALWKSALQIVVALLAAGLIAGWLGSIILGRLIPPLRAVVEQAKSITERRFVRIAEPGVPELAKLADAMNQMVERVQSMFDVEAERLEAVRREANYDSVTKVPNRAYFIGRLGAMLAEETPDGVLVLFRVADLAEINLRLGREATDELLRRIAAHLSATVAVEAGALAGRLGGADFAVLGPGESDAGAFAESILARLRPLAESYGLPSSRFVHVGALAFGPGMDAPSALAQADAALAASESGATGAVVTAGATAPGDSPKSAADWRRLLDDSLARGRVKLQPFPVIDLRDDSVDHWECALRMRFTDSGDWQPAGKFLPVAERLGLVAALDRRATELGIEALEGPLASGRIAINLSPQSAGDPEFRAWLATLLGRHRALAPRLSFEVPESGALAQHAAFSDLCSMLVRSGARCGVEHVGREFSQIGRLHNLGLAYLKVDSSFVRGIDTNPGNQAFLRGLRAITATIDVRLCAEGAAREEELRALAALGFDAATGPAARRPDPW